jgi:hypothetical protein
LPAASKDVLNIKSLHCQPVIEKIQNKIIRTKTTPEQLKARVKVVQTSLLSDDAGRGMREVTATAEM